MPETQNPLIPVLFAICAAALSGTIGAFGLYPAMQVIETMGLADIVAFLLPFAVSSGLAFGLIGGALLIRVLNLTAKTAGIFLVTSMIGIAAAVYVAILGYDRTAENFMVSYAIASPIGALLVAVPLAFLGRFAHPWRTIGLATVVPTLWAVGVAAVFDADATLEVPGLAALYIGWQGIFLALFAATGRRD